MIRVSNIKMNVDDDNIERTVCSKLGIKKEDLKSIEIRRRSLDARKKEDIHYLYTVDAVVKNEDRVLKNCRDRNISRSDWKKYELPEGTLCLKNRPVVVGFGPAGMFAALVLAEKGMRPIVLERGRDVDRRTEDVESFWNGGKFNPESNVQFGEGGAGTFSDGKLTTRTKDKRSTYVTEKFIEAGASKEIAYDAKPHIGTDKLKGVVKNIRNRIIDLGGEVRFESRLTDIKSENGKIKEIVVNGTDYIETENVVLAVGHSARDTFEMLKNRNIALEQKPFAAGVRIEHRQSDISFAQYGKAAEKLPPADYMLTYTTKEGRGVYSFCMCPGGYVVAAASEEGRLVVNGMSEYTRDGENANSALLVQVNPSDFGSDDPLAGVEMQRRIEEAAFRAGGGDYSAPVQRYGDFVSGKATEAEGKVRHSYKPKVKYADLNTVLPKFIAESLKEAIPEMGKRLKGFDSPDALMTGVETRSSSPVRIVRDKEGVSLKLDGLYPAGEGAGYAGGIVSAAVDGVRQAENIIMRYMEEK
ncbi:MAG: NAD(P)/FAD-dependent oxidoreductase [Clostridiales bacterium]|nr:NAD(P)/FAD-dependent oxidoreductase [Clostridiales bacterium]